MKKLALSPQNINKCRLGSERGVILLLACFSMPVLVSLLGIGIDLSVMYSIKAKLQMACDGAAVAALRSLGLAQDTASQTVVAQSIATQWFNANFAGDFLGATGTTRPVVTVTDLASVRSVSISVNTQAPTYFMKYWGRTATPIGATSQTSRRDVAIMLVLDRSGSMGTGNYNGLTACQTMVQAAKQFTGLFQQGRDSIGLVTFGETVQVVQTPTTSFQTALGYSNTSGSSPGALDTINCVGGTNTPSAVSIAWNELYKLQLPGALNIIVVFTDGLPTAASFDFSAAASGRGCQAANWISAGGEGNSGSTVSLGANSYFAPFSGMIGSYYADGSPTGFTAGVDHFFTPTGADPTRYELPWDPRTNPVGAPKTAAEAPGCQFPTNGGYGNPSNDLAYIPAQDLFGNSGSGYITSNIAMVGTNFALDKVTMSNVITNLTDNAANFARNSHIYANGSTMNGTIVNTIGLGGNGGVDFTLLQRMANDQAGDQSVPYPPYPGYNTNQPQGHFVYAPDGYALQQAFLKLGSQILRISR